MSYCSSFADKIWIVVDKEDKEWPFALRINDRDFDFVVHLTPAMMEVLKHSVENALFELQVKS